jgi:hypothetical protein
MSMYDVFRVDRAIFGRFADELGVPSGEVALRWQGHIGCQGDCYAINRNGYLYKTGEALKENKYCYLANWPPPSEMGEPAVELLQLCAVSRGPDGRKYIWDMQCRMIDSCVDEFFLSKSPTGASDERLRLGPFRRVEAGRRSRYELRPDPSVFEDDGGGIRIEVTCHDGLKREIALPGWTMDDALKSAEVWFGIPAGELRGVHRMTPEEASAGKMRILSVSATNRKIWDREAWGRIVSAEPADGAEAPGKE